VETTGNVTLKGTAMEQSSYSLTIPVKAGDAREAETLLKTS